MENALYKYLFIIIIIILSLPCVNNSTSEDANRVRAKWNSE